MIFDDDDDVGSIQRTGSLSCAQRKMKAKIADGELSS